MRQPQGSTSNATQTVCRAFSKMVKSFEWMFGPRCTILAASGPQVAELSSVLTVQALEAADKAKVQALDLHKTHLEPHVAPHMEQAQVQLAEAQKQGQEPPETRESFARNSYSVRTTACISVSCAVYLSHPNADICKHKRKLIRNFPCILEHIALCYDMI